MPAWCYWYNDSVNQYPQGTLYNWYSVNDSRNICPQGWKVPTIADWTILFANFGGNQLAGEALKDTGTIENGTGLWHAPNLATNISDFTCVPLGYRSQNGTFGGGYEDAWYWTNSINVNDQTEGVYLELHGYSKGVGLSYADRKTGFSVRCVQSATSNLNELTSPKKEVLYYTNTLGQKVSPNNLCNAIVIVHYDDGSTLLKFIP